MAIKDSLDAIQANVADQAKQLQTQLISIVGIVNQLERDIQEKGKALTDALDALHKAIEAPVA